jgi:hypothetical protein
VRLTEARRVTVERQGAAVELVLPEQASVQLYYGDSALPLGWWSATYGERRPIWSVVARIRFVDAIRLATRVELRACAE